MGKFDIIGTEQALKQEPNNTMPQKTKGGNFDIVGTTAPLKNEVQGTGFTTEGGKFDLIGSTVSLKTEGKIGWGPLTNVAENQVKKS